MSQVLSFLHPNWPAPAQIHAAVSLRAGGVSSGPYASLNLGDHVGDAPAAVAENRRRLRKALALPAEPFWLQQVHGTQVIQVPTRGNSTLSAPSSYEAAGGFAVADASWSQHAKTVCAILSADCLPVLFCNDAGTLVAAAHAGWRGLASGVLESTLRSMPAAPQSLMAWLGPAIGPGAFEVGDEVREQLVADHAQASAAFQPSGSKNKWRADLNLLARQRLTQAGVTRIYGGTLCTHSDSRRFFSHRRDGVCGRMATLIWKEC